MATYFKQRSSELPSTEEADWDTAKIRHYLVDAASGSDANLGYVDALPSATSITPTGLAWKTLAKAMASIPTDGAGRMAHLHIKAGDYSSEHLELRLSNYKTFIVRGSTDLTYSSTDKVLCGGVQAIAGSGTDGAFTVDVGATTTNIPIKIDTLTAAVDNTSPRGHRVRFTSGAMSGSVYGIRTNTATSIDTMRAMTSAPAENVTFQIERPGVVVASCQITYTGHDSPFSDGNQRPAIQIIGLDVVGFSQIMATDGARPRVAFCRYRGNVYWQGGCNCSNSYTTEELTLITVGVSTRVEGTFGAVSRAGQVLISDMALLGSSKTFFRDIGTGTSILASSFSRSGVQLISCGTGVIAPSINGNNLGFGIGTAGISSNRTLVIGAGAGSAAIDILASNAVIRGVEIENIGARPAIKLTGTGCTLTLQTVTGSAGNTDVGLDLTAAHGCDIKTTSDVTITGSSGDVRLAGGAVLSHAALTASDEVDGACNRVQGQGGFYRSRSWDEKYLRRAISLCGLNPDKISYLYENWALRKAGWTYTGTFTVADEQGGMIRHHTGGGQFSVRSNGGATQNTIDSSKPFYCHFLMRIGVISNISSSTYLLAGIFGTSNRRILIGHDGAQSTTVWAIQTFSDSGGAQNVLTSVNITNQWTSFELFRRKSDSKLFYSIGFATPVELVLTNGSAALGECYLSGGNSTPSSDLKIGNTLWVAEIP